MIWSRVLAIGIAVATAPATAQPVACDACVRGDAVIDRFSLQPLRPLAAELAALPLAEPLTPEQYTRVIELRQRTPALVRLGAIDDTDLARIASALCRASSDACTVATTLALRCLADRCVVALPTPDPSRVDVVVRPENCNRSSRRKRSPRLGLGMDWGTGWHRSKHPNDGANWSFGIETRMRIGSRLGAIARVDRLAGRDEAIDGDGNGIDDISTGSITRISGLAGPSFVLHRATFEDTARFLRLDLLAGYVATRSQPKENGPAAGFDLAYQLSVIRTGVRVVQAFGDASDATMVLAHLGFVIGSGAEYSDNVSDCRPEANDPSSRLALGFDMTFGGYGISSQLGYLSTGIGLEAVWHLTPRFDAIARADLQLFPGDERDRVLHQAVLGGIRIDHAPPRRSSRTGFFTTLMAGYSHGAALTGTTAGSGPIVDVSEAWGGQGREGAGYIRLHARFGVTEANIDYRALFLSAGFELRFDPRRW